MRAIYFCINSEKIRLKKKYLMNYRKQEENEDMKIKKWKICIVHPNRRLNKTWSENLTKSILLFSMSQVNQNPISRCNMWLLLLLPNI